MRNNETGWAYPCIPCAKVLGIHFASSPILASSRQERNLLTEILCELAQVYPIAAEHWLGSLRARGLAGSAAQSEFFCVWNQRRDQKLDVLRRFNAPLRHSACQVFAIDLGGEALGLDLLEYALGS